MHGTPGVPLWSDIGVLTRDNAHAAELFDHLTAADIPVEIVGLSGLLRLPEVAEVVAVAAPAARTSPSNASLLTLLTGPRWAIGPRDLKLLGDRARELAGVRGRGPTPTSVDDHLVAIADGIDPAEIPCLDDALNDPGEARLLAEALERFALLAGELRMLRSHVGEPLLDIVRRIIDTTGADVELASITSQAAVARRDNLDLFVRAVADFQAVDGDVTLVALLAYLTAEDEESKGLEVVAPSAADSVKLLTVHRAKGLEWEAVFLVGVCDGRFPSNQSRTLWTSSPAVLPAPLRGDADDLPQLRGYDKAALETYREDTKKHEKQEELRLGYVAFTRAAHRLSVTSYCWSPRLTPFGPSAYQELVRAPARGVGRAGRVARHAREGRPQPVRRRGPVPALAADRRRGRGRAPAGGRRAGAVGRPDGRGRRAGHGGERPGRRLGRRGRAAARRGPVASAAPTSTVPLPGSLSASAVLRLQEDPDAFARELARPMPRPPSAGGPVRHAVPRLGRGPLQAAAAARPRRPARVAPTSTSPTSPTWTRSSRRSSRARSPTACPHAVEASFALVLDGQVVRGRIDAIYQEDDGSFLVVDWKTNRAATADPLQLAIYRLAWAELVGVPLDQVRAAFHYVRTGETVFPDDLPDRAGLEGLLQVS